MDKQNKLEDKKMQFFKNYLSRLLNVTKVTQKNVISEIMWLYINVMIKCSGKSKCSRRFENKN